MTHCGWAQDDLSKVRDSVRKPQTGARVVLLFLGGGVRASHPKQGLRCILGLSCSHLERASSFGLQRESTLKSGHYTPVSHAARGLGVRQAIVQWMRQGLDRVDQSPSGGVQRYVSSGGLALPQMSILRG